MFRVHKEKEVEGFMRSRAGFKNRLFEVKKVLKVNNKSSGRLKKAIFFSFKAKKLYNQRKISTAQNSTKSFSKSDSESDVT